MVSGDNYDPTHPTLYERFRIYTLLFRSIFAIRLTIASRAHPKLYLPVYSESNVELDASQDERSSHSSFGHVHPDA